MRKSPAWTEQLRAIYPLPVMEVGVICRVRAFPPCQDAAESRGPDQHASFGMPWLWQILPTTVQQNQDEKGICDFLKAKVWRREENSKGHLKHLLQARGGRGMSVCLSVRLPGTHGCCALALRYQGRWARLAPASHTLPCTGTSKGDIPAELWTCWAKQAGWVLIFHVLFPIYIQETIKSLTEWAFH